MDDTLSPHRYERLVVETDAYRIEGLVALARDGFRSRISDLLNASERDFIAMTDVTMTPLHGDGPSASHEFVAVSRRHIVLAFPVAQVGVSG